MTGGAPVGDRRLLSPILSGCIPGSCTYYARAHDSSIDKCLAVHLSLNRVGEDEFDHERCETHETIAVAAERLKLRRGRNLCDGLCVERKSVEDRIVPKLVFSLFVYLVSFVVEIAIGRDQRIDEIYEGVAAMMRRCV